MRSSYNKTRLVTVGWQGLSRLCGSLGIPRSTSAEALRSLHRRHGLPVRGSGKQGSDVYFEPQDIQQWVRFLTGGVSLDLWEAQLALDAEKGMRGALARQRPESASGGVLDIVMAPLLTVLSPVPGRGEGVHRVPGGLVLATTKIEVAEDFGVYDDLPHTSRLYRYASSRLATRGDLAPRVRVPRSRRATSLLVALRLDGKSATYCRVPAVHFGGCEADLTALILSVNDPSRNELVRLGQREFPDATWFVWNKRKEVRLITLDEPPPPTPLERALDTSSW